MDEIMDFYFELAHFIDIYEELDDKYVIYGYLMENGEYLLKLFNVDPSVNLRKRMEQARSTTLFSATLLPIQYYKNLLGGEESDFEMYAKSIFDPNKKALFVSRDATTKYSKRTKEGYEKIASYIHEIVKNRQGNYMVFLPSHAFLNAVYDAYMNYFCDESQTECILQDDVL